MKKMISLFLVLFIVLLATACNSSENVDSSASEGDVSEVKIGSIHPMSGVLATDGTQMSDAIEMAVEEINEAGGIKSLDGAKLTLVNGDIESNPEKGISEVQRLEREGVSAILGTYMSAVALTATQEAERLKVPFVVDIASADDITERGFSHTFRLQPPVSKVAEDFLTYFKELNDENGNQLKTAVISYEDSVMGASAAKYVEEHASEEGIEILASLSHPADSIDLTSEISKIKSLNPDMIISTNYLEDGLLFIKSLKQSGFEPKAIFGIVNGAFSNEKFIEETDINEYIIDTNYAVNTGSELAQEVINKYKELYGQGMGPNAAYAYTATKLLAEAIERAGSTDREKIRKALSETNFSEHILAMGTIEFNEKGQNKNAHAVFTQIIDGDSLVVYPEEFKEGDIIFPIP